jgi:hypothetical protein
MAGDGRAAGAVQSMCVAVLWEWIDSSHSVQTASARVLGTLPVGGLAGVGG